MCIFSSHKNYYSTNGVVPAVKALRAYRNADLDKLQILKENQGKAGVYRWTNLINGNTYIGSSTDLGRRLREYYNINYLERVIKKGRSVIISALLKQGYANFSLEILCECDPWSAICREQYYIDLLKPEYNILQKAGSSLGLKHSEETIQKMKDRTRTEDEKIKHLERLKIMNSSVKHRKHLKRLNSSNEHQEHLKRLHRSLKGRAKPEGSGVPSVTLFD